MAMTLRSVLATRPSLWHLEPELKQLRQPVLLVVGDEDAPCIEPTLYLKGALTQSGMAMLPRTGHLANLEEPDLFNGLVFRFLTAVEQGRWHGWNGRVNGD
jgi:pimeloyl-ACP methyl ester carboxylesterase